MIECNYFEISAALESKMLNWKLFTDLPCGTSFIVSCERRYSDYRGSECTWSLFDDRFFCEPQEGTDFNGANGTIDIEQGDSRARDEFNDMINSFSKGMKGKVGDGIVLSIVVSARQRIKAFGKNNINLQGSEVFNFGGINIIEVILNYKCPMNDIFQPIHINR